MTVSLLKLGSLKVNFGAAGITDWELFCCQANQLKEINHIKLPRGAMAQRFSLGTRLETVFVIS